MNKISILLIMALICNVNKLFSQEPQLLYPNGAPQSNGLSAADAKIADGRYSNTSVADYYLFLPEKSKATGQAVVICPGGGYGLTAYDHEGLQVARWFNSLGVAAVVLRYRMPNGHHEIPLSDVHETIRMVRKNAAKWNIDPKNVGIMGFSAGGHLASTAATHFDEQTRPDFAILIYPVITIDQKNSHKGSGRNLLGANPSAELIALYSNEKQVTALTPRTFLALSDDDKTVPSENSILFYRALKEKNIPAELHIYPTGGHGWGWKTEFKYLPEVKISLARWITGN